MKNKLHFPILRSGIVECCGNGNMNISFYLSYIENYEGSKLGRRGVNMSLSKGYRGFDKEHDEEHT